MKRFALTALLAAATLCAPLASQAQQADDRQPNSVDRTFVQQAVNANDSEIFHARAMQHSRDAAVRRFAAMMLRDHTLANSQIGALASQYSIPYSHRTTRELDADFNTVNGPSKSPSARTRMVAPAQYMRMEVADHKKAIALFQGEKTKGGGTEFKVLAARMLPVLEKHLSSAEAYR